MHHTIKIEAKKMDGKPDRKIRHWSLSVDIIGDGGKREGCVMMMALAPRHFHQRDVEAQSQSIDWEALFEAGRDVGGEHCRVITYVDRGIMWPNGKPEVVMAGGT